MKLIVTLSFWLVLAGALRADLLVERTEGPVTPAEDRPRSRVHARLDARAVASGKQGGPEAGEERSAVDGGDFSDEILSEHRPVSGVGGIQPKVM
jgi:hypothetical protein